MSTVEQKADRKSLRRVDSTVTNCRGGIMRRHERPRKSIGSTLTAIHAWEQGRRHPDRAARILLAVIEKEPITVQRALTSRPAVSNL